MGSARKEGPWAAAACAADQLVVTGDITNLAIEHEYEDATALLDEAARRTEVTVVPGNHDIYLPSLARGNGAAALDAGTDQRLDWRATELVPRSL